jgi:hypothetical protein
MTEPCENAWKNVRFTPAAIAYPQTVGEVQAIINGARTAGQKIKAVGGRHSMNHVFRTGGVLVDLSGMKELLSCDPTTGIVEVEAGCTLGDIIVQCAQHQWHFPSLGSWYTQSIAGAIATSTHGSSLAYGSLSEVVLEVEAVLADGSVQRFSAPSDELKAMRCHLGRLGILTKVKLQLQPAFSLSCKIQSESAPDAFRQILHTVRSNDYVSLLWIPDSDRACIRVLTREIHGPPNQVAENLEKRFLDRSTLSYWAEDIGLFIFGHLYLTFPTLLSRAYSRRVEAAFCDDDGVVDTSYRVFLYDQYREPTENHRLRMIMNVEYAFDVAQLEPLLKEIRTRLAELRERRQYLNYPRVHVRFAKKSEATLMGLNADRDTAYVGIYVVGSVRHRSQIPIAEAIEETFLRYDGRPHWGKYRYLASRSFEASYGAVHQFERVRGALDPTGMFSEETDMFDGLDRFEQAPIGSMLLSLVDPEEYQDIKCLERFDSVAVR